MRVRYVCCCTVYPPGSGVFFDDGEECSGEGTITVSKQDWQEGTVSLPCPTCGAMLYQVDGHFEEVA